MQAQTEGRGEVDLALLLRTLRARGPLSRAQRAARSGLAKVTVSPLPADLEHRCLVERAGTTTTRGRTGRLVPPRPRAVCGIGLDASPHACAPRHDRVHDPEPAPGERVTILRTRAERGDARTLGAPHRTADAPASGRSVLAALLNLRRIVLGGYFAALQDWLVAPQRHGRTAVTASTLGFTAGGKGAARRVLDDPTVVPVKASAPKTGGSHEGASA